MSTNQHVPFKQQVHVCLTLLIWLILAPIMVRWTYQTFQNRQSITMQKRYVNISLACCTMCILWTIISIPLDVHLFFSNMSDVFSLTHTIVSTVIHCATFHLLSQRFYMLFFNINWTNITLSSHWMIHIRKPSTKHLQKAQLLKALNTTPNYSNISATLPANYCEHVDPNVAKQWFIKHQSKYGSIKNVCTISNIFLGVTCAVYICFCAVIYFFSNNLWQYLISFLFLLLPYSIIIHLWINIPNSSNDQFFFFQEMRKLFIVISITCCLHLFSCLMTLYIKYVYTERSHCYFYLMLLKHIITLISSFATVYFQTQWVINQIKKQNQILNTHFENMESLSLYSLLSFAEDTFQSNSKRDMLLTILQCSDLLDAFVKYLSTENCMGLMFAFIEFTQLKRLMERNSDMQWMLYSLDFMERNSKSYAYIECNEDIIVEPYLAIQLPREMTRSSIVHNKKYARMIGVSRYRKIIRRLNEKYLENGSIFELPISTRTKRCAVRKLYNKSCEGYKNLYNLYDECMEEIYLLLMDSCDRFIKFGAFRQSIVTDKFGVDLGSLILSYLPSNGLY